MSPFFRRRRRVLIGAVALAASLSAVAAPAAAHPDTHRPGLPLGAADLPESRQTQQLQPGVTLTTITRGVPDTTDFWTIEVSAPDAGNPDPDAPKTAITTSHAAAQQTWQTLHDAGIDARLETVDTPPTADTGGFLGYRVRVGSAASSAALAAELKAVKATGLGGSAVYTGWDGDAGAAPSRGTWHLQVLTIDPRRFHGRLLDSYGPDFVGRETTSALAAASGAFAGVNAGFFVLDPKAGAPGDPAGIGVYDGRVESEATNGRPALVVHDDAANTGIERLWWRGDVRHGDATLTLDGLNRVPGLIRNCGGTPDDSYTDAPQQDVTCTDPDEVIAFDAAYGAQLPTGDGAQVVLDARDRVVSVADERGGAVPAVGRVLQATGTDAAALVALAPVGAHLAIGSRLVDARGHTVRPSRHTSIVNGGPLLVRDGRLDVTVAQDGMVEPAGPSFYYGWVHKRNPRTVAGVDARGRLVLITADGRSTDSLGLSIPETAAVAKSLGLRQAMNLDGGGSTTMVVNGSVLNSPSDAAGERPVGDALLLLPDRH
ncbi:phosphodiester glycosidase family protein [Actinocatenispora comari]|uniref:Phosphodiester glycosidase domain-containing protein n=1 Tax=Actinocatenispora comari TaxID=2807577 RepID=A0A8J4ALA6_9ACTN|nr:phosphodiester glycosidase family protein [Actinocatenispora comari]GIL31532.1 hypothetical protein NUM_67860 [Actinocatenispora comari]